MGVNSGVTSLSQEFVIRKWLSYRFLQHESPPATGEISVQVLPTSVVEKCFPVTQMMLVGERCGYLYY